MNNAIEVALTVTLINAANELQDKHGWHMGDDGGEGNITQDGEFVQVCLRHLKANLDEKVLTEKMAELVIALDGFGDYFKDLLEDKS